jgi:hypothetical protein
MISSWQFHLAEFSIYFLSNYDGMIGIFKGTEMKITEYIQFAN